MTSNYIIFVATKEKNFYICARSIWYWIINYHYYHDYDHFIDEIVCEHKPVWIKNFGVIQNCIITELNRQQVKEHLPVFSHKYQSIVHWICSWCSTKITAALLIKRVITVTWFCCLGRWSALLSSVKIYWSFTFKYFYITVNIYVPYFSTLLQFKFL